MISLLVNMRIKPKLMTVAFIVSVIPIVLFAFYFGYLSKEAIVRSSLAKIATLQTLKKEHIENSFSNLRININDIANSTAVHEIIKIENIDSENNSETLARMLQKDNHYFDDVLAGFNEELTQYLKSHNYADLYIIDSNTGNVMYSVVRAKDRGLNALEGKFKGTTFTKTWRESVRTQKTVLSDFDIKSFDNNRHVAFVAHPVLSKEQKSQAVLLLVYDTKLITDSLLGNEKIGTTVESYIMGYHVKDNSYGLRSVLSERYENKVTTGVGLPPRDYWQDAVDKGYEGGQGQFIDALGNQVLAAYSKLDLPGLDWFLIAKIDVEESVLPVTKTYQKIIFAVFFFGITGLVVVIVLAKSFSRPIIEEMKYADDIANGHFGGELNVMRKDEIGDLGRSLENMSSQLFIVDWTRRKQESLDNLLRGNRDINTLCQNCINFFVDNLNAKLGAIYLNCEGILKLEASHSFSDPMGKYKSFGMGDGLVGQAALDGDVHSFKIPDGPSYNYGVGEEDMKDYLAAPLVKDDEVVAVILLGSIQGFPDIEMEFIKHNLPNLAILLDAVISREKIV